MTHFLGRLYSLASLNLRRQFTSNGRCAAAPNPTLQILAVHKITRCNLSGLRFKMFKCLSHLGAAKHTVQFHISAWSSSYKPRLPLHCRCRPKCQAGLPQWKVPKAPKRYRWHEVTSAYDDGLMLKMVWWWRRCLDQFGQLMSVHSGMHCFRLCGIVDLDGVTLESTSRAMFQLQKPETCLTSVWVSFSVLVKQCSPWAAVSNNKRNSPLCFLRRSYFGGNL